jgi:hypothetical protein
MKWVFFVARGRVAEVSEVAMRCRFSAGVYGGESATEPPAPS